MQQVLCLTASASRRSSSSSSLFSSAFLSTFLANGAADLLSLSFGLSPLALAGSAAGFVSSLLSSAFAAAAVSAAAFSSADFFSAALMKIIGHGKVSSVMQKTGIAIYQTNNGGAHSAAAFSSAAFFAAALSTYGVELIRSAPYYHCFVHYSMFTN